MINNKRVIVTMTSWKKRITNVGPVVFTLLKNTIKPDLIVCNLSTDEFPNKEKDLPEDLLLLQKTTCFEIHWVKENTRVFKKFIPTLKRFYGEDYYMFTVDDDEQYYPDYLETGIKALTDNLAAVIAERSPNENGVWGGMFCCHARIFKPDYWENISRELLAESMNDLYTNNYLAFYDVKIRSVRERHTKKYNDIFPNRGGKAYSNEKIKRVQTIVNKIFSEKFKYKQA